MSLYVVVGQTHHITTTENTTEKLHGKEKQTSWNKKGVEITNEK